MQPELHGLRARHSFVGPHPENRILTRDAEIERKGHENEVGRGGHAKSGGLEAQVADWSASRENSNPPSPSKIPECSALRDKLDALGELEYEEVTSLGYLYSRAKAAEVSFREHVYTWASLSNGYLPLSRYSPLRVADRISQKVSSTVFSYCQLKSVSFEKLYLRLVNGYLSSTGFPAADENNKTLTTSEMFAQIVMHANVAERERI